MKSEEKLATNNIYLTTRCNFACEYCYEKRNREEPSYLRDATTEDLNDFFRCIVEREGMEKGSVIFLYGGEPFLRYDLFWDAVSIARQYSPKQFWFSTTTNGLFLSNRTNFYHYYWNFLQFVDKIDNVTFSTDISYDGSGHYRRISSGGKPTKAIAEKAIENFEEVKLPYKIRYTLHKGNAENFKKDIVEIIERFPTMTRLEISPFCEEIDEFHSDGYEAFQKSFDPFIREVYKIYKKPICTAVYSCCDLCNNCTHLPLDNYYAPDKGEILQEKYSEGKFDHF
jgi:sulfatase maturation enzyme AslB (radical SAM superfamily)